MTAIKNSSGPYSYETATCQLAVSALPKRFRLKLEVGRLSKAASRRFKPFIPELEVSVPHLLTYAPLRHGHAPYTDGDAIAKETMLWLGWLGVHVGGKLDGRLVVSDGCNAGRQSEFSAGLAECLAVALLSDVLGHPLATIQRIPESGAPGEAMDFRTPTPKAVAIEAKAGHGSCVGTKKKEIAPQMARQTVASRKYGAILCYEKRGSRSLKAKGSYLHVYDPASGGRADGDDLRSMLRHYLRVANTLGFWVLVDGLRSHLGLAPREGAADGEFVARGLRFLAGSDLARLRDAPSKLRQHLVAYGPGILFSVSQRMYLARAYYYDRVWPAPPAIADWPRPVTVIGLSLDVVHVLAKFLLAPDSTELVRTLVSEAVRKEHAFQKVDGSTLLGPISYAGLEDGVARVDLTDVDALMTQDLEIE